MEIRTDWNYVATLCCIGLFGILICGMAKWIDEQSQRIDTLELEMISLKGPVKVNKPKVYWHGKVY
jgi:TRAP-type C4-dicarboxylate transport system permease small subunit